MVMAKGERSINPFRDDDDIRQDMNEDLERRHLNEMERRDDVRAKSKKSLSSKSAIKGKKKDRAVRNLVKQASAIKSLNKSDIKQISSFASAAAKDYKAPEIKNMIKKSGVKPSLLGVVGRAAGVLGAAATMAEFRKVHNAIKKAGPGRNGGQTLLEILKK
jgi:hypothetical protein